MKHRLMCVVLTLCTLLASPVLAASSDDEPKPDARYMGYRTAKVDVDSRSPALVWVIFFALMALGLVALFKDARRSHLD
jgi:hypothetical protein